MGHSHQSIWHRGQSTLVSGRSTQHWLCSESLVVPIPQGRQTEGLVPRVRLTSLPPTSTLSSYLHIGPPADPRRWRAPSCRVARAQTALSGAFTDAQLAGRSCGPAWSPCQGDPFTTIGGRLSANLAGPGLWPSVWGNLIFLANNAEPQTLPQGFCPPTACGVGGWCSGEGTRQTGMPCWSREVLRTASWPGPIFLKSCPRAIGPNRKIASNAECLPHARPYADSSASPTP